MVRWILVVKTNVTQEDLINRSEGMFTGALISTLIQGYKVGTFRCTDALEQDDQNGKIEYFSTISQR